MGAGAHVALPGVTQLVRDRVSWLLYLQLGTFGYFLYGFGPVVPLLRDELEISRTVAGLYGPALAVGSTVGGAVFPYLVRRLGQPGALWTGAGGLAAGVSLLCLVTSVPATLAASVLAMTFGIVVVSGVTTALHAHHGLASSAAISEANGFAAGIGLLAPLLIGLAVSVGAGWRTGMAGVVLLAGVIAVAARSFGVRVPAAAVAPAHRAATGPLPGRFWLAWGCVLATGAVEVSLSLWASEQLRERVGMAPGTAAAGMSAVLVGMVVGRVAGGRVALRRGTVPLLVAALGVSAVGFGVFWVAVVPWLAVLGLVLCGLGISLHFPLGVALTIGASQGRSEAAMARVAYAMALGSGAAPFVLGALADRVGIGWAFSVVPVCLATAGGLVWRLAVLRRRDAMATERRGGEAATTEVAPG